MPQLPPLWFMQNCASVSGMQPPLLLLLALLPPLLLLELALFPPPLLLELALLPPLLLVLEPDELLPASLEPELPLPLEDAPELLLLAVPS
jgi:hypothetical protein